LIADSNFSGLPQFSHSQGSGVSGRTTITYDGTNGSTLNPIGLGAQDLTRGGQDNTVFVNVTSDDLPASMTVRLYTNATQCSSLKLQLPGQLPITAYPKLFVFRYYDFLQDAAAGCTAGPVNPASVGAIVLVVDGTQFPDTHITFGLLETGSLDYGDAPDTYRTNYNADATLTGAAHVPNGLRLGALIDTELGLLVAGPNANNDDTRGLADEDGVVRANIPWHVGIVADGNGGAVQVTVNGPGCLMGWIDWGGDGSFTVDPARTILNNMAVTAATYPHTFTFPFDIPAISHGNPVVINNNSFNARFRLYPPDAGGGCLSTKSSQGPVYGGEVEDYHWGFGATAVTLSDLRAATLSTGERLIELLRDWLQR